MSEASLSSLTSSWQLGNDEIYSRGVDGKELAIYQNGSLSEWPVWGVDNVGKLVNVEV